MNAASFAHCFVPKMQSQRAAMARKISNKKMITYSFLCFLLKFASFDFRILLKFFNLQYACLTYGFITDGFDQAWSKVTKLSKEISKPKF
jgi:hypothetical protein